MAEILAGHAIEVLEGWAQGEVVEYAPSLAKGSARIVIYPDYDKLEVKLMRSSQFPDGSPLYEKLDSMSTKYWSSGFMFNVICMISLMAQFVDDSTI